MPSLPSLLRGGFGRPRLPPEALARVKAWAAARLPNGTALAVNEIVCTDPGCPGTETVILVMTPGQRTRAVKISKSLDEVAEADVAAALAAG